jgi:thiol-disulfide isomerase/thioredoxin
VLHQAGEERVVIHWFLLAFLSAGTASAELRKVDELTYPRLLESLKGQVVLVNFWATWCAPCREEMPQLVAIQSRLHSKGLRLITVSADEPESESAAGKFLDQHRVAGPRFVKRAKDDDQFIRLVDEKWSGELPALILYDKSGKRVRSFFGETDMKALEAAIARLL